jgi:hypothetical protein
VPDEAQTNAVKLRWWQLGPAGRMTEDWAIDSFIIDRPLNISLTALEILKQRNIPSRDLDPDYQAEEPEEPVNPTHMRQSLDGHCGGERSILNNRIPFVVSEDISCVVDPMQWKNQFWKLQTFGL